jgi:hypothetical protein
MGSAALVRAKATPPATEPLPKSFTRMSIQLANGLPMTIDLDVELRLVLLVPNGLAKAWRDAEPTAIVSRSAAETDAHRRADLGLQAPGGLTAVASGGGGVLTSGTYYYEVTAVGPNGESLPSEEVSAPVTGPGKVAVAWTAVTGADSYRVYRAPFPGHDQVFYGVRTASFTDKGLAGAEGPAPAPPPQLGSVDHPPVRVLVQGGASLSASVPLLAGQQRIVSDAGGSEGGAMIELAVVGWDIRAGSLRGAGDFGSRLDLAWRRAGVADDQFEPPPLSPRIAERLQPELRMQSALGLGAGANGSSG